MWDDLSTIDPQFRYFGERSKYVRFPLGGIGSGGFSISGSGRLVDWSIRNRPALQSFNGYSHFAIKAVDGDRLIDARVLNGPYDGDPAGSPGLRPVFDGFGHGANRQSLAGVPHFSDVAFYGRFPTADLTFRDPAFPGAVRLTALSPFIPHEPHDSSMPVAMLSFDIANDTDRDLDYTLAGTLGNHGSNSGAHDFRVQHGISALTMLSTDTGLAEWDRGDLTIATDAEDVQHQDLLPPHGDVVEPLSAEVVRRVIVPGRQRTGPGEIADQPAHAPAAGARLARRQGAHSGRPVADHPFRHLVELSTR